VAEMVPLQADVEKKRLSFLGEVGELEKLSFPPFLPLVRR